MSSSRDASEMDIVVGSGPSGLAVTLALLARGRKVTMIDGGALPDAAALARQAEIAAIAPGDWTDRQIVDWQAPQFAATSGMARRYGSDHAHVAGEATFANAPDWFGLRASHAVGGLSNVWGAALLPSRAADMAGWPITADELAPHYSAISKVMSVSGRADALEPLFGAFPMAGCEPLRPGPQARALLRRLDRIGPALAEGVHAGQARQAVAQSCKYCGMCLHGCPWDHIFSARHALEKLHEHAGFRHLPGRLVTRVSEEKTGAQVHLADGTTLTGARVFLGAGVLETARIVLASMPDKRQVLKMRDSQHFFLPLLHRWRADGHPEKHAHHTLAEVFVEIDDGAISPYLIHNQIYGWNEFYAREMITRYGRFLPGSAPVFRALARRLMVAQGFLHSDHSAHVTLALAGDGRLTAECHENPATAAIMAAAQRKLARSLARVGLYGLRFSTSAGAPGSSFHSGATLPMAAVPKGLQTDTAGRLAGMSRVHVVDASVLSAIPATTITFTVMANAHRIGSFA